LPSQKTTRQRKLFLFYGKTFLFVPEYAERGITFFFTLINVIGTKILSCKSSQSITAKMLLDFQRKIINGSTIAIRFYRTPNV